MFEGSREEEGLSSGPEYQRRRLQLGRNARRRRRRNREGSQSRHPRTSLLLLLRGRGKILQERTPQQHSTSRTSRFNGNSNLTERTRRWTFDTDLAQIRVKGLGHRRETLPSYHLPIQISLLDDSASHRRWHPSLSGIRPLHVRIRCSNAFQRRIRRFRAQGVCPHGGRG